MTVMFQFDVSFIDYETDIIKSDLHAGLTNTKYITYANFYKILSGRSNNHCDVIRGAFRLFL